MFKLHILATVTLAGCFGNLSSTPLTDGGSLLPSEAGPANRQDSSTPADAAIPFDSGAVDSSVYDAQLADTGFADASVPDAQVATSTVRFYVGLSNETITSFDFDDSTGMLVRRSTSNAFGFPSGIATNASGTLVYAIDELGAGVRSFRAASDGALTQLGSRSSGDRPAHLALSQDERSLFVANFESGTVTAYVTNNGDLSEPQSTAVDDRAHQIVLNGSTMWVPCLGADRLVRYNVDGTSLTYRDDVRVPEGRGPRHLVILPRHSLLVALHETTGTVTVHRLTGDGSAGGPSQELSTLPDGFEGDNMTSEIVVDSSERFIYTANRGHDSIAVFEALADGTLIRRNLIETGGRTPRSIALTPSGRFLLVGNQDSNQLRVFRVQNASLMPEAMISLEASPHFVGAFSR